MIDWGRVAELRAEIGEDSFGEVIALFLEETDEVTGRLSATAPEALGRDLHFLKGSALNLGFAELGQLCEEGEWHCRMGAPDKVERQVILDSYAASKAAFQESLPQQSAA
jgi:HPt (histidine-containing phosphotransfer) domain-containing protein